MNKLNVVWLASYPRSGNTFLRTILWHCFGLRSASVYPNDLGSNRSLEEYVGHIEHDANKGIIFPANSIPLIKTHQYPIDRNPAIYVVRDGRAAAVSLWRFYSGDISFIDIIEGRHRFGTWSDHVNAWRPWERSKTLLINYEEIRDNLPTVLVRISNYLERDIVNRMIPRREDIAGVDGQWVRSRSNWRSEFPEEMLELFNKKNNNILIKLGYTI